MTKAVREVKLGHYVRDVVTGVEGTAIQYLTLLNGTIQFGVQPKVNSKDRDKVPEAWNIDDYQLEYVEDGLVDKVVPPPANVDVGLGDKVKDKITGLVGVATMKAVFINGCVYFSVQPEITDKKADKLPEHFFLSHERLQVVKRAVLPPPQPVQSQADRPPGGPMTRTMRRN